MNKVMCKIALTLCNRDITYYPGYDILFYFLQWMFTYFISGIWRWNYLKTGISRWACGPNGHCQLVYQMSLKKMIPPMYFLSLEIIATFDTWHSHGQD